MLDKKEGSMIFLNRKWLVAVGWSSAILFVFFFARSIFLLRGGFMQVSPWYIGALVTLSAVIFALSVHLEMDWDESTLFFVSAMGGYMLLVGATTLFDADGTIGKLNASVTRLSAADCFLMAAILLAVAVSFLWGAIYRKQLLRQGKHS
jgi:hypothetical protein